MDLQSSLAPDTPPKTKSVTGSRAASATKPAFIAPPPEIAGETDADPEADIEINVTPAEPEVRWCSCLRFDPCIYELKSLQITPPAVDASDLFGKMGLDGSLSGDRLSSNQGAGRKIRKAMPVRPGSRTGPSVEARVDYSLGDAGDLDFDLYVWHQSMLFFA